MLTMGLGGKLLATFYQIVVLKADCSEYVWQHFDSIVFKDQNHINNFTKKE